MEAIGQLAGGVAHDFNNLLTVIAGNVELLAATLGVNDPRAQHVQDIRDAADRASALTRQLLAFSRRQVLAPRRLDLNDIVAGVEKMLRRLIGEHIVLEVTLAGSLPPVKVDPSQLEQALINLALNARDAMPAGGRLEIRTGVVALDERACAGRRDRRPGTYCQLSVRDTGCGIPPDVLEHVFEPFFTTKGVGQGTGLGLSSVYGLVTQSGGFVDVTSEVGVGTTFHIALPASGDDDAGEAARNVLSAPRSGEETILVVEDDPAVRRITRLVLERRGYDVREASSAAEALELAAGLPHVHLVVSDVVMPGMSGPDLVRRLQGRWPRVRVLFMSGYIDDAVTRHGVLGLGSGFLQKPFSAEALAEKVREILDA